MAFTATDASFIAAGVAVGASIHALHIHRQVRSRLKFMDDPQPLDDHEAIEALRLYLALIIERMPDHSLTRASLSRIRQTLQEVASQAVRESQSRPYSSLPQSAQGEHPPGEQANVIEQ